MIVRSLVPFTWALSNSRCLLLFMLFRSLFRFERFSYSSGRCRCHSLPYDSAVTRPAQFVHATCSKRIASKQQQHITNFTTKNEINALHQNPLQCHLRAGNLKKIYHQLKLAVIVSFFACHIFWAKKNVNLQTGILWRIHQILTKNTANGIGVCV